MFFFNTGNQLTGPTNIVLSYFATFSTDATLSTVAAAVATALPLPSDKGRKIRKEGSIGTCTYTYLL